MEAQGESETMLRERVKVTFGVTWRLRARVRRCSEQPQLRQRLVRRAHPGALEMRQAASDSVLVAVDGYDG